MARCNSCGADLPDYYTSCPNCGGTSLTKGVSAPASSGYVPISEQRVVTTMAGWFGWTLLCGILPIIGPIIMKINSKDPTAKNYATLMIILQIIGIFLSILLCAILVPAMIGYVKKAQEMGMNYGMLLTLF